MAFVIAPRGGGDQEEAVPEGNEETFAVESFQRIEAAEDPAGVEAVPEVAPGDVHHGNVTLQFQRDAFQNDVQLGSVHAARQHRIDLFFRQVDPVVKLHRIHDLESDFFKPKILFHGEDREVVRLCKSEGLSVIDPPKGSFYLFINIKATGLTSAEASDTILRKAHVLTLPGNAFGHCGEGYIRIACTCSIDVLKEAFDRIEQAL